MKRFKILQRISSGRFAETFEATDNVTGERMAVKVARDDGRLPPPTPQSTLDVDLMLGAALPAGLKPAEVLSAEATLLNRHTGGGLPKLLLVKPSFLALEYLDGFTMDALAQGDTGVSERIRWVRALALTLSSLSQSGTTPLHGDIKPSNAMVAPSGEVTLINPTAGMFIHSGQRVLETALFTPIYNPFFEESDQPAFGLTALEALTGKHPLLNLRSKPRAISDALTIELRAAKTLGRDVYACRLPRMSLLRDALAPDPESLAVEAVLLRCVGLSLQGETLGLCERYTNFAEVYEALDRIGV